MEQTLKARKAEKGLIFHSDRGVQYACNIFKDKLKALKIGSGKSCLKSLRFTIAIPVRACLVFIVLIVVYIPYCTYQTLLPNSPF
jgi:hypothetical protein